MKANNLQKPESTIRFSIGSFKPPTTKDGSWTLALPTNVSAKFPAQGITKVEGIIDSLPFQTIVEATRGSHVLKLSKAMHDTASKNIKEPATVEFTLIGDELETRVPADLHKALTTIPKALATWKNNTPLARKDWIFWLISAKQSETRKRRIEKACNILGSGKKRVCCFGGINWLMKTN